MYSQILVPVDLATETTTEKLCRAAGSLAEKYQAQVKLMTVIPGYGMPLVASYFPKDAQEKLKKDLSDKLQQLSDSYFSGNATVELHQGKRTASILQVISNDNPDLVMLGCRRKKSRDNQRLQGSTSSSVSNRAGCSVMIVR